MNKKIGLIVIGLLVIILGILFIYRSSDAKKFKKEYSAVSIKNKFVYKDDKEVINMLKTGTGIIYFGFPECPWCQQYSKYLDEVANDSTIKEVVYLNVLQIRKDNTKEYQELVSILKDYLNKDDKDNPRIFVPHVVAVKDGKILGNNNETATISEPISTTDYWTKEKEDNLKVELKKLFDAVTSQICTTNCNE